MDNNDNEQKAALAIIGVIVGTVVVAVLAMAAYFGITAGKGDHAALLNAAAAQSSAPAALAAQAATGPAVAVKIFFETAKAEVPASAADDLAPVVNFLKANPAATVAVSGYHDASGNAEVNAEVSKERAKAVRDVLVLAGVEAARVTLEKPQVSLGGTDADARRVEVIAIGK
ncbi:OmpA family protein [Paraherbaspirillum soli]|uniref:OmpA family protein n=1 Tax=Paraherbaspirillum soli TaxID=631222 RepID=A0ABW0MB69_9BURK